MKHITIAFALIVSMLGVCMLFPACSSAQKEGIVRLDNKQFSEKLTESDYILLDVRTPEEFEASRLQGAILINVLDKSKFLSSIKELDKNKKILVYCRTGNRSVTAANLLIDNGFKEVFELRNGIMGWNGPVISGKNK